MLAFASASVLPTSSNSSGSLLDAGALCFSDCFSDVTLEGAGVGTSLDAEHCTCRGTSAVVCVVDTGTVFVGFTSTVDRVTGATIVEDTRVVLMFVVETVMDFSGGDVVVVTVGNGAGVEVVTGDGILTVFSAVVCSLEGDAVSKGVVTWTFSVFSVTATAFSLAVVVTVVDVAAVGGGHFM